ncbi:MAG: hypothetical protein HY963_03565 [Ignavibacteriales bacterium]|nr:hypothetical protein [Ignavibacteriales bacterium]
MSSFFLILIPIFFTQSIFAQQKIDKSFYGGLFYLTNYMTSDEYKLFLHTHNDLETVDHIYEKALTFFDGDYSETFFCLTFTLIPYNKILMKLPVIGLHVTVPLPSPPKIIFDEKLKNTPKRLFNDSPSNDFGDKDKLAHFFANAFLHYNISFFNLSKFLGIFVEYFEQGFFLQGEFDKRDLITNHLGEIFAEMVQKNKNAMPSEALKIYQLLFFRIYP